MTNREPATASSRMRRQRERDTACEMLLRRELFRRGLRYRVHRRPLPPLRREADIVFPTERVAVFVDGCFWHGCAQHGTWPATNVEFWRSKIESNRGRDRDTDRRLQEVGWVVARVWEHEDPVIAADAIEATVRARRPAQ